ncbi:MAG: hypothetical protein M1834_000677 [Cirrosporium novae-zelandiae]|nr:MAG: hypothetical protein M1834_000677 [Cirrosporium novae-zelandiae]
MDTGRNRRVIQSQHTLLVGASVQNRLFCHLGTRKSLPLRPGLVWIIFRALKWQFLAPIFPRLCLTAFQFVQSFLVNEVIEFLETTQPKDKMSDMVYIEIAISNSLYQYRKTRFVVIVRGGLISMLYDKSLTAMDSNTRESNVVTLMTSDTERIIRGLSFIHEVRINMIETAIAI